VSFSADSVDSGERCLWAT